MSSTDTTILGSYISVVDFDNSYTGLNPDDLAAGELARAIKRASDWVNRVCRQQLYATLNTVTLFQDAQPEGYAIDRNTGYAYLFPKQFPIRQVASLTYQYGINFTSPTTVDAADIMIVNRMIVVQGDWRYNAMSPDPLIFKLSYVNGYAVTQLAAQAASGTNQLTLKPQPGQTAVQGFLAGTVVELQDTTPEFVTVLSTTGNTVTLTANLANTHAADTMVAPADFSDVQAATLLATSYHIKTKGLTPLSLHDNALRAGGGSGGEEQMLADARDLLVDFTAFA